MKKEDILEKIKGYKFLAIDTKEKRVIVIMSDVTNGYNGYTLKLNNLGYSLSPFYITSTFIKNTEKIYDFTNDINNALNFLENDI